MDAFLQCFEGHSRNLFPDTGSSLLGACTKEFTACGFTSFSICSFSFVVNLSAVISLSFCFRPNSAHQLGTAPWVLSWFAERIVRNKSSVFDASALKCMVSLFYFLFRILRLTALMLLFLGGWFLCFVPPSVWR